MKLLSEVQLLTYNAMTHSLLTDFEPRMRSALNQIYPDIPQVGCLFHLSKNVFKHVQYIGLTHTYLTDPLCRGDICMIPALSFVPIQVVILAFDQLYNHCGTNEQHAPD